MFAYKRTKGPRGAKWLVMGIHKFSKKLVFLANQLKNMQSKSSDMK